jgi:hypothetical protein
MNGNATHAKLNFQERVEEEPQNRERSNGNDIMCDIYNLRI